MQDFGPAASNEFIKNFNYNDEDLDYAKVMANQHFYGTKMDLYEVVRYTSAKTEKVYIHTDTLWMSSEITEPINFELVIRARRVSLPYPLPMVYSKDTLFSTTNEGLIDNVKRWVTREEHVKMSNSLTVRARKLGRIEIVDALPTNSQTSIDHSCVPLHTYQTFEMKNETRNDLSNIVKK